MSPDLRGISGVPPSASDLRVLHIHGRGESDEVRRLADHERALGWQVTVVPVGSPVALRRRLRRCDVQVVALHGRRAGTVGRLLLRGSRATVLVPGPGRWCRSGGLLAPLALAWERTAARWASAVLLADGAEAAVGVRRGVWVPPFVVGDSLELRAAVLTRAHAFGRPGPGLAAAALRRP